MRGSEDMQPFESLHIEQLHILLERETSYRGYSTAAHPKEMPRQHSQWRPKICEWCYRVVDHFEYDRQVVFIAMEYFDRFLCIYPGTADLSSRMYQLAAMTCLYMAMKIHANTLSQRKPERGDENSDDWQEVRRRCVRLSAYVELSRGQFYPHDVERMECMILETLDWKMNPVTPMCFVSFFLMLIPLTSSWIQTNPPHPDRLNYMHLFDPLDYDSKELVMHVLHELARYLTELATICLPDLAFSTSISPSSSNRGSFKPSVIAYSAILLSMDIISFRSDLNETVRCEFVKDVARLSMHGTNCEFHMHSPFLHPNHPDVVQLKRIIQDNFLPEMVLEQAFSVSQPSSAVHPHSQQSSLKSDQIHPILIAKQAGILNLDYVQNIPSLKPVLSRDELDRTVHDPQLRRELMKSKAFSPTSVLSRN